MNNYKIVQLAWSEFWNMMTDMASDKDITLNIYDINRHTIWYPYGMKMNDLIDLQKSPCVIFRIEKV